MNREELEMAVATLEAEVEAGIEGPPSAYNVLGEALTLCGHDLTLTPAGHVACTCGWDTGLGWVEGQEPLRAHRYPYGLAWLRVVLASEESYSPLPAEAEPIALLLLVAGGFSGTWEELGTIASGIAQDPAV